MNPEEEARDAVMFAALSFDDQNYYAKWEAEMSAALDNYRTAIEQRVLAQQPCEQDIRIDELVRMSLIIKPALANEPMGDACTNAHCTSRVCKRIRELQQAGRTARQTQETSG